MFEIGRVYRRRELHDSYGGQRQGGISTPAQHRMVLLFMDPVGQDYGYSDGWQADGTFHFAGEGRRGDMQFVRGNAAIRDHQEQRKALHLFQAAGKGQVRYMGEMVCLGHDLVPGTPDLKDRPRTAIVFRLAPVHVDCEAKRELTDGAG